jgi:hypothetical protein
MTATQHGGTLRHSIFLLHHYKNYAYSFSLPRFFILFFIFLT